jgi:hypothetical protein
MYIIMLLKQFSNIEEYVTWNVNSVISLKIMLFGTYSIDKSEFEHYIFDVKLYKIQLHDLWQTFLFQFDVDKGHLYN